MGGKTKVQAASCKVFSYSIHRPGIPQTSIISQPAGMLYHALCLFGTCSKESSLKPCLPGSGKRLSVGTPYPDIRDRLWGRALNYHIHMLVPAGGPDPEHMEWVAANKKFFVPVKALSKIFRGIFMEKLFFALQANQLRIPEKQKCLYAAIGLLKKEAYSKFWHVYIKKTFQGANQMGSYLGR